MNTNMNNYCTKCNKDIPSNEQFYVELSVCVPCYSDTLDDCVEYIYD